MEREMAHDFYLLKAKKELDINKEPFYLEVWDKKETDQYIRLADCWFHHEFMEYIFFSFTGLSVKLDLFGVSLIKEKSDAIKLRKVCAGWITVISEVSESILIGEGEWEVKFKREDLLQSMKALKDMAEQMVEHDDYVILYGGI